MFCHRCGEALATGGNACRRCGAPRRAAATAAPPALPYAQPLPHATPIREPFRWAWCHFFRNACLVAAIVCVLVSGTVVQQERGAWTMTGLILATLAVFWHGWHAEVCLHKKGPP